MGTLPGLPPDSNQRKRPRRTPADTWWFSESDPQTLIDTIVEVSTRGAAPKQNPALFALALAASVPESSQLALAALPRVARTGTHLFLFAAYVEQFRGWGRGLRRAVGSWYTAKGADAVAYQVVKYRQREGWSHRICCGWRTRRRPSRS